MDMEQTLLSDNMDFHAVQAKALFDSHSIVSHVSEGYYNIFFWLVTPPGNINQDYGKLKRAIT